MSACYKTKTHLLLTKHNTIENTPVNIVPEQMHHGIICSSQNALSYVFNY